MNRVNFSPGVRTKPANCLNFHQHNLSKTITQSEFPDLQDKPYVDRVYSHRQNFRRFGAGNEVGNAGQWRNAKVGLEALDK